MDEEHEVYGGDIPDEVEGDLEVDSDGEPDDLLLKGNDGATDEAASKVPRRPSGIRKNWFNFLRDAFGVNIVSRFRSVV